MVIDVWTFTVHLSEICSECTVCWK